MNIKRIFFKNKNFKFGYYVQAILREYSLLSYYRLKRTRLKNSIHLFDPVVVRSRLDYYNKLNEHATLGIGACQLKDIKRPKKRTPYYFDLKAYLRYFDQKLKLEMIPGDVIVIPETPAIVKSRPIMGSNRNAVLLNLDKTRHFNFIQDHICYRDKKNILLGRASVYQEHRSRFYDLYFDHPMCDLGDVSKKHQDSPWFKSAIRISDHLQYKFILALEGNDVATNLKWIMSSNSIAVMPTPKYETWFMEGLLLPDVHYIHIRDDYSDLEEKLNYYIAHPEKAEEIIMHAHAFVQQFQNHKLEDLISIMVLEKYFEKTGQRVTPL
ncbi:lipopolysaccharide biosynthesis protein [Sphingobacterium sp. SRCM116780]|uniref:glycosyl transferase family 90 n=1 Tax=Sphingobacterium sp. SRCM116780 TaxID=2907623 RepID=UPI001F2A4BB7|nr:glycosyl transferase family 90 [Sphingobacterium sp. SRCM116780]UIR55208.1 lipopolysaccharide biosynthesis protein [Sphingobacterium sp. SRCM116780]